MSFFSFRKLARRFLVLETVLFAGILAQSDSLENCIGYNQETNNCTDCAYGHFRDISQSFVNLIRPVECVPRISTPYKKTVYVSTMKCPSSSKCNGTAAYPYDSWYKAMWNEGIQANKVLYSELDFRFLNSGHMIMRKEVLVYPPLFFRRINVSLTMRPYYCDEAAGPLAGCFADRNSLVDIYLKTDAFYIFVALYLSIRNVNFYGNDLVLNSNFNKPTDCYNLDQFCCPLVNLSASYNGKNLCGLNKRTTIYSKFIQRTIFYSFLNLEPIFDDPFVSKSPQLALNNTNFFYIYSIKPMEGLVSIIALSLNSPGKITLTNTNISSLRIIRGVIFVESQGIFYPKDSNNSYFENSKFEKTIKLENVTIEKLNEFQMKGDSDLITETGLVCLNGYLGDFSMQNVTINNNLNSLQAYSIFTISNCQNVTLQKISLYNSSRQIFLNINSSNVRLENLLMYDYQFYSPMINMSYGKLDLINVSFFRILGGAASIFNISEGNFISLINSTLKNSSFLGFTLKSINFSIINSSFDNCYFNRTPFDLTNLTLKMQNVFFLSIKNDPLHFFLISSDQAQGNEMIFEISDLTFSLNILPVSNTFVSWSTAEARDFMILHNIKFIECSISNFIFSSRLQRISISNIKFLNSILNFTNRFNFLSVSFTLNITIKDIDFRNLWIPENFIYISQGLNISSIIFENLFLSKISQSAQRFILVEINSGIYRNITIENFYSTKSSDHETVLFSINNHLFLQMEMYSMILLEPTKLVAFYLSECTNVLFFNNLIYFDNSLHRDLRMKCLILISFQTENIRVENFSSLNLEWNLKQLSISYRNGFLNFLSSETYLFQNNTHQVVLNNLSLLNCGLTPNGAIGFVSINKIFVSNIYFSNPNAVQGGAIFIMWGSSASISRIIIENSKAEKGGAIFAMNLNFFIISNSIINKSSANIGGALSLEKINSLVIDKISILNVFSENTGGAIFMKQVDSRTKELILLYSQSETEGGGIYFDGGTMVFENLLCYNCFAERGGFIFIFIAEKVNLKNITVEGSSTLIKGGSGLSIMVTEAGVSVFEQLKIKNLNSPETFGNIYIENKCLESITFKNFSCTNNSFLIGSCVYFTSNNKISFFDSYIRDNNGTVFYFTSILMASIGFENLDFQGNQPNKANPQNFLLDFQHVNISLKGQKNNFSNNSARSSVFNIIECEVYIENITFTKNTNAENKQQLPFTFVRALDSTVKFYSVVYNGGSDSAFYSHQRGSTLSFNYSTIQGCETEENACLIISKVDLLIAENSIFSGCRGSYAGAFSMIDTSSVFRNSTFYNNSYVNPGNDFSELIDFVVAAASDVLSIGQTVGQGQLLRTTFHSCSFFIQKLSIEIISQNEMICIDSSFLPIKVTSSNYRKAFLILDTNLTSISGGFFENFLDKKGSAIEVLNLDNSQSHEVKILNSIFDNNRAEVGGCAFFHGWLNVEIMMNVFANNSARQGKSPIHSGIGGVAYLVCKNCNATSVSVAGNLFKNNTAEFYAPTILSLAKIQNASLKNEFIGNRDAIDFTKELSFLPLTINISEFKFSTTSPLFTGEQFEGKSELVVISGIDFSFNITLQDSLGNIMKFDNSSSCKMNKSLAKVKITRGTTISKLGVNIFDKMRINYMPGEFFSIDLLVDFKGDLFFPFYIEPNSDNQISIRRTVLARKCIIGEVFIEADSSCSACPQGEYSIIDPMDNKNQNQKCLACPENTICKGSDRLTPIAGYWRASAKSTKIIQCICLSCCLGGSTDSQGEEAIKGKCLEFHQGPLCYLCEAKYARFYSKGPCENCKSNSVLYLKLTFALIGIYIYIMIQLKFTFRKTNSQSGILIKQLINHLQQLNMISLLELGWTNDIKSYFKMIEHISFAFEEIVPVDCIIIDIPGNLLAKRVIMTCLMPFILSIFTICIFFIAYFIDKLLKKKRTIYYVKRQTGLSFVVIFYLLFPEILRKCFSFMTCIELDDVERMKVLLYSPDIQCWSFEHGKYLFMTSFPGIAVWGLLVPILVCFYLWRRKHKQNLVLMRFFSKGYQQKYYFWEFVMFSKKIILIFISTHTELFPSGTKATILLLIFILYLFLQIRHQPFDSQSLNQLEYLSLFTTFATANVGVMLSSDDIKLISLFFLVIIILLHFVFILLWLKLFVIAVFFRAKERKGRYLA